MLNIEDGVHSALLTKEKVHRRMEASRNHDIPELRLDYTFRRQRHRGQSVSNSDGQVLKRSMNDHTPLCRAKTLEYIGKFKNDVMIPGNEVRKCQLSM